MAISPAVEAIPATAAVPSAKSRPRPASVVDAIAALVVFACFAVKVVPQTGGRDGHALLIGLVTTTFAFVATRSWRHLRPRLLMLLASLPAAALLVCLLTPPGGAGFKDAAGYAYAAVTFGFVAALTRTPARRTVLVIGICALGLDQFGRAFLPWWGGEDAGRSMIGTFYWHNQFGAYMLAVALAAGVAAVFGAGVLRQVGLMVAPVCAAAVGLSASRGSVLLLAAGWIAVGFLALIQSTRRARTMLRWALVAAATAVISTALTSSMFFPKSGSGAALSGVERRNNSSQTAENNLGFRVAHDKAAIAVFREAPLKGVGYQSYAAAASRHLPLGLTRSPWVHNGYLQAAVDGGLLLLLPLVLCLATGLFAAARFLLSHVRTLSGHAPQLACAVAAVALLAHSAVDVDWTYPALSALLAAIFAGAVGGGRNATRAAETPPARLQRPAAALGAAVLVLAAAAVVRSDQVNAVVRRTGALPADVATRDLLAEDDRVVPDARLVLRALNLAVPRAFDGRIDISRPEAVLLFARSSRLAPGNALVEMQRAQIAVAIGDVESGVGMAQRVVARDAVSRPFLIGELAEILAASGQGEEAQRILVKALEDTRLRTTDSRDQLAVLTETLARLAGDAPPQSSLCSLWIARSQLALLDPSQAEASVKAGPAPTGCSEAVAPPTAPIAPSR